MKDKLRVTFLLPNAGVGGGVRAIKDFGNGLISLGHDVRVIFKDNKQVDIARRVYRKYFSNTVNWLDYFQGPMLAYKKNLQHIPFERNEIVVSMCSQTTLDAYTLPEYVIKVMHCHGLEYENWDRFMTAINLPVYKLAISGHVKRSIEHYSPSKGVAIVPNGIHHSEYHRDDNILKMGVGGCVRQRYSKDPHATTNIFMNLHNWNYDIPLYSFGTGKKPSIVNILNYTNNPSVNEGRIIYNKCKVWFLSSIEEGFGLPVLESMACGCVVVSTKCGGPQDLIVDGYNGFNVEVGNYGAITYYIKKILQDDALCTELSKNALETAGKYSWATSSSMLEQELLKIYFRFLDNSTP